MDRTQDAVERAVTLMWLRYDEPLSLNELAETAILSKFYFSRVFRSVTGISPGRFLTAVRLAKAKRLLLETSLPVTDIAYMVGYNSLGTFTTRFTRSVGIAPTRYRLLADLSDLGVPGVPPFSSDPDPPGAPGHGAVIGKVELPAASVPVRIYVGAFASPLLEGAPMSSDVLESSGDYALGHVPEGECFIRAAAVAVRDVDPRPWLRVPQYIASSGAVNIYADHTSEIDLELRRFTTVDLPILLALPELDNRWMPVSPFA